MSFAIDRRRRTSLIFLAAAGYMSWFAGMGEPLEVRGEEDPRATTAAALHVPRLPRVEAMVTRDPFERPGRTNESAKSKRSGAGIPAPAIVAADDGAIAADATVPDVATPADTSDRAVSLSVRATIAGPNAVAYVANGSEMDIVRVGDTLGERKISAIDGSGIAFDDGSRLDLPDSSRANRSSLRDSALHGAITSPTREPRAAAVAPKPATSSPPQAPSSPPQSYPTPGPLRTVDARGIPPGANPTPDLEGPTPLAYPYPYAPVPRP